MSDGMRRELVYLSSHATNRYFIPNWGNIMTRAKWVRIDGKDLRRGRILTYTHTPHSAIAAQSEANHHEP